MSEEFEGFPPPTKNFFSLPNEMINIVAHIKNLAELKVIIYVIRHTWGYHEYGIYKTISVDEFMRGRKRDDGSRMDQGTGLSNRSVIDGLRAAVQHGYLICDVDASDLARVKKSYALRMINRGELSSPHEDTSYSEETTHRYEDTSLGYEESSQLGEDTSYRSEKYTNRKTLKKDTIEKQVVDASASTPAPVTDLHKWRTDSEKRRAMFADIPLSQDIEEDISMLETRKQEATDPAKQTISPSPGIDAAQAVSTPPASVGATSASGAVQASIPKRPRGKVTQAMLKTPEEIAIDERCRALQQRINEWRGYDLKGESKGKIINEHKSIRTLVETYTDEQIEQIYLYLFNRHWRWSKPDSRYNIGAYIILSEAKGVMMELKAKPKQNGKAPGKPDAYGNDYSLTSLIARQQKAM